MATRKRTGDALGELAGRGQETLARVAELPGGSTAVKAFGDLRGRVDELTRRVRGLDVLEARVAKLEKELATLKRAQKAAPKAPARKAAG